MREEETKKKIEGDTYTCVCIYMRGPSRRFFALLSSQTQRERWREFSRRRVSFFLFHVEKKFIISNSWAHVKICKIYA